MFKEKIKHILLCTVMVGSFYGCSSEAITQNKLEAVQSNDVVISDVVTSDEDSLADLGMLDQVSLNEDEKSVSSNHIKSIKILDEQGQSNTINLIFDKDIKLECQDETIAFEYVNLTQETIGLTYDFDLFKINDVTFAYVVKVMGARRAELTVRVYRLSGHKMVQIWQSVVPKIDDLDMKLSQKEAVLKFSLYKDTYKLDLSEDEINNDLNSLTHQQMKDAENSTICGVDAYVLKDYDMDGIEELILYGDLYTTGASNPLHLRYRLAVVYKVLLDEVKLEEIFIKKDLLNGENPFDQTFY